MSFSNMKEMRSEDFKDPKFVLKPKSDLEFFNKGQIGNWKNFMSDEQSKRIDEAVEKNLKYKRQSIQYEPTVKSTR